MILKKKAPKQYEYQDCPDCKKSEPLGWVETKSGLERCKKCKAAGRVLVLVKEK